jgi:hypothetical protein
MEPNKFDYEMDDIESDKIFPSDKDFIHMQVIRWVANMAWVDPLDPTMGYNPGVSNITKVVHLILDDEKPPINASQTNHLTPRKSKATRFSPVTILSSPLHEGVMLSDEWISVALIIQGM